MIILDRIDDIPVCRLNCDDNTRGLSSKFSTPLGETRWPPPKINIFLIYSSGSSTSPSQP